MRRGRGDNDKGGLKEKKRGKKGKLRITSTSGRGKREEKGGGIENAW